MINETKSKKIEDETIAISELLTVKIDGKKESVLRFLKALTTIVEANQMNISPMMRNDEKGRVHCYVQIVDTDANPAVQRIQG
jgi:hypothetical protein